MTRYVRTLMAICLCVMSSALCMGQSVKIYDTSNSGLIDNDLWAVVVDHDGNKWLGTLKYGSVKKDGDDIFAVFFREGMFKNVIPDIDLEGKTLWIATNFGLIRYEP